MCVYGLRVKNAQQRAVVYIHVHAHIQLYTELNYMWLAIVTDGFLKQMFQRIVEESQGHRNGPDTSTNQKAPYIHNGFEQHGRQMQPSRSSLKQ